jgi:uncharacterized protein (TIGR02147 family)
VRYSQRQFAADLGLSSSALSRILSGHRRLSTEMSLCVAEKLKWSPSRSRTFTNSVRHSLSKSNGATASGPVQVVSKAIKTVSEDHFRLISDWYHAAILENLRIQNVVHSTAAISKRLKLVPSFVREALARLERLKMVKRRDNSWISNSDATLSVPSQPSAAIREFHKGMINRAWESLDRTSSTQRDITGTVVATSPEKLDEARVRIQIFRRDLVSFLEDCEPTEVYHLGVLLFPLSEGLNE